MFPDSSPSEALPLLARLYRERRSGLLSVGPPGEPVHVVLRDGHVVGLSTAGAPDPAAAAAPPGPDDSASLRLDRILLEVGIRPRPKAPLPAPSAGPAPGDARGRLVRALTGRSAVATFEEGSDAPADASETAGPTEPLILEAIQALHDPEAVRVALGDLDRRLVVTAALAEERTLTLAEGYLLSRIDGTSSAREVLQLVPLDPEETERTLLGLLLTGRIECRAAAARPARRALETVEAQPGTVAAQPETVEAQPETVETRPEAVEAQPETVEPTAGTAEPTAGPPAEPEPAPEGEPSVEAESEASAEPDEPVPEDFPEVSLVEDQDSSGPGFAAGPALDAEARERKKEIWEAFQSLPSKNHFEVLDLEPGCSDADVKRAYAAVVKRFHPDAQGDPRLEDMHDILAGILIRAREALEVLGNAASRAQYEARSGIVRRPRVSAPPPAAPPRNWPFAASPAPPRPAPTFTPPAARPETEYVPEDQILLRARLLLSQARYWDVIQVLELVMPQMESRRNQHKSRILLAKAYAKNPKWVRRAQEYLDEVLREDATNVEANYELGLLYKQVGQPARAQAAFRRVIELKPEHREAAAELGLDSTQAGGGLLKRLFGGRGKAS